MSELLANFEIGREPRWPVLLRLVTASLALHIVILLSVVYVPGLRDAFNIATLIAHTSIVDKPYMATAIGDEVQVVSLSEKFHYPEGYFALDAPGLGLPAVAQADPFAPKIISQAQSEARKPSIIPSPSPVPTAMPSPSSSVAASPSITVTQEQTPGNANKNSNTELTPEEAQKELEKTA